MKLLIRSHAMRESTSPPRDPQNSSASLSHSLQLGDDESGNNTVVTNASSPNRQAAASKKITSSNNLSSNSTSRSSKQQLNNNEPTYNINRNAPTQSPKLMRNSATSPTCRTAFRNSLLTLLILRR